MNKFISLISNSFLNKNLDFRVRLFNVLAMAGTLISLVMAVAAIRTSTGPINIFANFFGALLSFTLLYYSYKSGKYQRCYMITIICIFFGLFTGLFFMSGGYRGGMPQFFIFAVLFTIFMLDGKTAVVLSTLEIAVYVCLFVYAYFYPNSVVHFDTEADLMLDTLASFLVVSISLGITMFLHFKMYNEQQRNLELARKEAESYSKAKSTFLANMSHEIRTPINVILGMNEMVLRESSSSQITGYGLNIQSSCRSLLTIINNILDISKIESGKLDIIPDKYSTEELISELSVIGNELCQRKALSFVLEADEAMPRELIGDYFRLKQIMLNLISNAAKYTNKGSVTLKFMQKGVFPQKEIKLCISVADTGIGIKQEDFESLFDVFERADLHSNRHIDGTGLGLAIAKQLTEQMAGEIFFNSVFGSGSEFWVEIPQKIFDGKPIGAITINRFPMARASVGSFIAPGGKILAVDDSEENLTVIRSLLRRTMLQVDTAKSSEECLSVTEKNHYDVILMDYMMPGLDGIETFRRLKARVGFDTPVIALTANAVAGVRQSMLDEGFFEYLTKPIMWQDLEEALVSALPSKLVTRSGSFSDNDSIAAERVGEFSAMLDKCGISLESGLRYLGGDIMQYARLAEFFTAGYANDKSEIKANLSAKNWESLKFTMHSLKSKALGMGALNMYESAYKLEILSASVNEEYISIIVPVLEYEWACAYNGLLELVAKVSALRPATGIKKDDSVSGFDNGFGRLTFLLQHNRQIDALECLFDMISASQSGTERAALARILQCTEDMEFKKALSIINEFKEAEQGGK